MIPNNRLFRVKLEQGLSNLCYYFTWTVTLHNEIKPPAPFVTHRHFSPLSLILPECNLLCLRSNQRVGSPGSLGTVSISSTIVPQSAFIQTLLWQQKQRGDSAAYFSILLPAGEHPEAVNACHWNLIFFSTYWNKSSIVFYVFLSCKLDIINLFVDFFLQAYLQNYIIPERISHQPMLSVRQSSFNQHYSSYSGFTGISS